MSRFYSIFILAMASLILDVYGQGYPHKKTSTGSPTTTSTVGCQTETTTTVSSPCFSPNETLAYSCPCQPVCGMGVFCYNAPCIYPFPPNCLCAEGYVRDINNLKRCIRVEECQCPGPNEVYNACNRCEATCTNPDPQCKKLCDPWFAGCKCRDGYVRDAKGICKEKYLVCSTTEITT